jgi:hypothetical protein
MFLNFYLLLGLWEDVRLKHQMHIFMSHDTRTCTKVRNDWDIGLIWFISCTMQIMGTWGFGIGTQHDLYMVWIGSWDKLLDELARGDVENKDFQIYLL